MIISNLIANLNATVAKYQHKHLLQTLLLTHHQNNPPPPNPFGITSRPSPNQPAAASNPSFVNGVATKDLHVDPQSSVSVRIFLPETAVSSPSAASPGYGGYAPVPAAKQQPISRQLPVVVQFHGGGFVSGSKESAENDWLCRKVARTWDAVVVAVGYRLAPESKYPAAYEDGVKVLNWVVKQANLGAYGRVGFRDKGNFDSFGVSMLDPWLAAHADYSRCVLLGASSGANIANYVARKAVEQGNRLNPVKIVAQVLMYPFFVATAPSHCETSKLATSYFYDKSMCTAAWKLFLPEGDQFSHHPAATPFSKNNDPPLKHMPPTLTVVAEHDLMIDGAIAYSEELRRVNVDAPVLEYKNVSHEFATLGVLLHTPQAQACAEDIAIWVKKYISVRGNELSY